MILSGSRLRNCTASMPRPTASGTETIAAKNARNSELPRRLPICSPTEFLLAQEVPKSPCTAPPSQER
ncbi:hypothetical protein D3C87_1705960 [compost metagenome]